MVKKYKIFYKNDLNNLYGGSYETINNSQLKYDENDYVIYKSSLFASPIKATGYVENFNYKKEGENHKYTGSLLNGEKNEKGTLIIDKDGTTLKKYNGFFKNNLLQGFGNITYANYDFFKGNFFNGNREEEGTYFKKNGYTVKGKWNNDKLEKGTINYKDGDKYIGDIIEKEIGNNSAIFYEYIKQGQGILTKLNGDKFEGKWANNELYNGTIEFKNGNKYEGGLILGNPDGKGKMKYKNGDIFDGQWFTGVRNGEGTYIKNKQYTVKGKWIKNKFEIGTIYYNNDEKYIGGIIEIKIENNSGIFYEYIKQGRGTLFDKDGKIKETGNWNDNTYIKNNLVLSIPKPETKKRSKMESAPTRPPPRKSKGYSTSEKEETSSAPTKKKQTVTVIKLSSSSSSSSSPPKEIEVLIKKLLLIFEDEKTKTLVNSFNMLKMNNFIDNNLSQFLIENKITVTFNNTISLIPVFTYMKSKDNDVNTIIEMLFAFANYRNVSNNKNSYLFTRNI